MIPGTTPTHTFSLPVDATAVASLRITYKQGDKIVMQRLKDDCTLSGKKAVTRLSQEDTLLFQDRTPVRIQIKVKTAAGDVLISKPKTIPVSEVLEMEVI